MAPATPGNTEGQDMAANPHKGQASIKVGDREYILELDFNGLVDLEESLGRPIEEIFAEISAAGKPKLKLFRTVFHTAIRKHHPEMTPEAAGDLILEAGIAEIAGAFNRVTRASFGEDGAGGADGDGDPKAPAAGGTGPDSSAAQ